ncbi:MAG: DUF924 family protein [Pseudomonadota bacterium]
MNDIQKEILSFWFEETKPEQWFKSTPEFDQNIQERFGDLYQKAIDGQLENWKEMPEGALAYVILLDQFSRNIYRGKPEAFATDHQSLKAAKEAVEKGFDQRLSSVQKWFLYLPYEHSEDMDDQRESVELFKTIQDEHPIAYDYALRHLVVIEKFGRFPQRNHILERTNTPEEEEYLAENGMGF